MTDRKARLRATIEADHAKSMSIFQSLNADQWLLPVPSDEGAQWQARDVLAHVAVSEAGQLGQTLRCIAGEVTVPDDFDLTRYNRRSVQKQAETSVEAFLAIIEGDHAKVLAALEETNETDFDKTGRHARGDFITVEQFFHRITEHRREHAEAIQAVVSGQ